MTETTLTRRRDENDRATEWVVQGPEGAVSFAVAHTTMGEQFLAIGLHHVVTEAHEYAEFSTVGDCHILDGGRCNGDAAWRAGSDLGAQWDTTGRRDETVYAELTDWYTSRFAR